MTPSLEVARAAFVRQDWRDACVAFENAAAEAPLTADDQEQLAVAAYLTGHDGTCVQAWEAAHRAALDAGDHATAARAAVLLALCLVLRGQMAQAGGWLARAEGVLEESGVECAASGYVLIPKMLGLLDGDPASAAEFGVRVTDLGKRFDDADLRVLGVLGHGQALIALGDIEAGVARLDEVMVSVVGGEVGAVVAGIAYCAVIIECLRLYDLTRAAEWTGALSDWCDAQPDLVPYRGQCLVHRSQLHQAAGRWPDALTTAEAACRHLADPPHPALGLARYQEGELHRLLGDFARAESEYREASRCGFDPVPGLALLELALGDLDAAATTIRRALAESGGPLARPPLLAAAVEIRRTASDLAGARQAAEELAVISAGSGSELLRAMAAHAVGSVLVTEGDPLAGLAPLRAAAKGWRSLRAPYDAARTAVVIALALAAVGDRTAARLELDNARTTFSELGARPDLDRVAILGELVDAGTPAPTGPGGESAELLSAREVEVLVHLAAGETNREIAEALVISQHTVGRHVENIFAKLGVSSRAAATAYAYEHRLLTQR